MSVSMFARVRKNIAEFLDPPMAEPLPLAAVPVAPKTIDDDHPAAASEEDFLAQLKSIIVKNGAAHAGRINVIGLAGLKERFGPRWPIMMVRVHTIAQAAIERCLSPNDVYLLRDDRVIIAFASATIDDAQTKCLMIAKIIEKILLGEEAGDALSVSTAVVTVEGSLAFRDLPSLDRMITRRSKIAAPLDVAEKSRGAVEPAEQETRPDEPSFATAIAVGDMPPETMWKPVWGARVNLIPIYRATVGEHLPLGATEEDVAARDIAMAEATVNSIGKFIAEGNPPFFVLPVHFDTLTPPARRARYLAALSHGLTAEDKKFLLICLVGIPNGVVGSRLIELTFALRPFCRGCSMQLPIDTSDFDVLKGTNAYAVGTDLSGLHQTDAIVTTQIHHFARLADRAGWTNRFINGVASLPLLTVACDASFATISGPIIGKPRKHVAGIHPLTLSDITHAQP